MPKANTRRRLRDADIVYWARLNFLIVTRAITILSQHDNIGRCVLRLCWLRVQRALQILPARSSGSNIGALNGGEAIGATGCVC